MIPACPGLIHLFLTRAILNYLNMWSFFNEGNIELFEGTNISNILFYVCVCLF